MIPHDSIDGSLELAWVGVAGGPGERGVSVANEGGGV